MEKLLVKALLRVVQVPEERFSATTSLREFVRDFNIGWPKGASLIFDAPAKARIRTLLAAEGVNPATALDAWAGLTRAESLQLGRNEKWTDSRAKRDRVAIKTLAGRPLRIDGQELRIPDRCHLDVDGLIVAGSIRHDSLLVVENWECFNDINAVALDFSRAGDNPLVVWRGDRNDTRTDAAMGFLRQIQSPLWAFVDYDPAGLLIALTLPRLAGVLAPAEDELIRLLDRGLEDRYRQQLPASTAALDASENLDVMKLWRLIRHAGRALPQEVLLVRGGRD